MVTNMTKEINFHNEDYYYKIIGKNVLKYRNFKELTQEQLADLIESTQSYITDIERNANNRKLSLEMAGRIADNLNIPIKLLFDETNNIVKIKRKKVIHSNDYYYEIFRKNFRRYRRALGITQDELSESIKMSRCNIGAIESPKMKKHFTIKTAGKIADALNLPLSTLFDEDI